MQKRPKLDFVNLLTSLQRLEGETSSREQTCPYKGLESFTEADEALFFGRSAAIDTLREKIKTRQIVAVTGPSGSGKSSLVAAGLTPRLRLEHPTWQIVHFRPGPHPIASLAAALVGTLESKLTSSQRVTETTQVVLLIEQQKLTQLLLQYTERSPILLVIDQFEELYTLCTDRDQRTLFINSMLQMAKYPNGLVPNILITLRADFVGHAMDHRALVDEIQDGDLKLGPMTSDEIRSVIEGPARLKGFEFEDGLVARIVTDVGMQPGALPLLEFALTRLWDYRLRRTLQHSAYEKIGQLSGAIANSAESTFRALGEREQMMSRRILSRLVRLSDDAGEETRQRLTLATLFSEPQLASGAGRGALESLVRARLLTIGRDEVLRQETVEVIHEALIRRWPRFRQWLQDDHDLLVWRQRLDMVIREWQASARDAAMLLRGPFLDEARLWLKKRIDDLTTIEREFVETSLKAAEEIPRETSRFIGELYLRSEGLQSLLSSEADTTSLLGFLATEPNQNTWKAQIRLYAATESEVDTARTVTVDQIGKVATLCARSESNERSADIPDLLKGVNLDRESLDQVRAFQVKGATSAALELLLPKLDTVSDHRLRLIYASVLFDMLQARGRYADAASLIEQELALCATCASDEEELVLNLRIRLIHHYMFYKPVGPLWNAMKALLQTIAPARHPNAYIEVLFMLGGNLGALRGRYAESRPYLVSALRAARDAGDEQQHARCLRKYADYLRERHHLSFADAALRKAISLAARSGSRQRVYAAGSMADLKRQMHQLDESRRDFENALVLAKEAFIPGWLGNLSLGLARTIQVMGDTSGALTELERAEAYYQQTKPQHAWGGIQVKLLRGELLLSLRNPEWRMFVEEAVNCAHEMGYVQEEARASTLLSTGQITNEPYMFL